MKVLKIENNQGYYVIDDISYEIIDINKDDIFKILNIIFDIDTIEMDEINDKNQILNEAEKVIYKSIYNYVNDFISKKSELKKELDEEFVEIEKLLNNDLTENE